MRGEIWSFAGNEGAVRPPLLVVQDDALLAAPTIAGLVVTTRPQRAGEPLTVALDAGSAGFHQRVWVKVTQVQTVPARHARERLGSLDGETMASVDAALATVLGLRATDATSGAGPVTRRGRQGSSAPRP